MSLIKWTPLSLDPFDEMDHWFDWTSRGFTPAVDVWQDENNVYVESPLAGVDPKDVEVSVENDILVIQGKSEKKTEVDEKNYYRKEVRSGAFHRAVALPASVKADNVSAEFENGILKVSLPKEERVKPKKVEVRIKEK